MKIRQLNPITPGSRHQIILCKNLLVKVSFLNKSLLSYHHRKNGRGMDGHISVWHKGGGHKRLYRKINFGNFRSKLIILGNFYDPNRSSFISLVFNLTQKKFDFLIMTEYVFPGSIVLYNFDVLFLDLKLGYRTLVKNISAGSFIHSLSMSLSSKIKYIRSAGTFGQLIQKTRNTSKIRLSSGFILIVSNSSAATIGSVSNLKRKLVSIGKAGRNRCLGIRPTVRGVAMNPIDHPHGGKTNGGRACVTPWALPTRGKPTKK